VELVFDGDRAAVPASVDQAAYRIVQESLTNVLRHAGSTAAAVRIGYLSADVEVDVSDAGRARPGGPVGAEGHGIAGMRERAAAVGGTLEAGPRAEGGFRVHAVLPLRASR
jgi:signal transduction histidine kinase